MGSCAIRLRICLILLTVSLFGCGLIEEPAKKGPSLGLIITPQLQYSTQKARTLGKTYHQNLEQLVNEIAQNPVTQGLQFANNINSVGGIGFFTHTASKAQDERYLEVILGVPDNLYEKFDFRTSIDQLFSKYGPELLSVLSSDVEIYKKKNVAGYGLNFSWRSTSRASSGPRDMIKRVVIYILKEEVRRFLTQQIRQRDLLGRSVIFAIEGEGPARRIRYIPPALKREVRPPTAEEAVEKSAGAP